MRKKKEKMESVLFGKDVDVFGPAGDERVGVGARKSARTLAPAAAVAELGELFVEVGAEDVHIGPGVAANCFRGPPAGTPRWDPSRFEAEGHRLARFRHVFEEDVHQVVVQELERLEALHVPHRQSHL